MIDIRWIREIVPLIFFLFDQQPVGNPDKFDILRFLPNGRKDIPKFSLKIFSPKNHSVTTFSGRTPDIFRTVSGQFGQNALSTTIAKKKTRPARASSFPSYSNSGTTSLIHSAFSHISRYFSSFSSGSSVTSETTMGNL